MEDFREKADTQAIGAKRAKEVPNDDLDACKEACVAYEDGDKFCVGFDWSNGECWLFDDPMKFNDEQPAPGVIHYERFTNCEGAHWFYIVNTFADASILNITFFCVYT